MEERKLRYSERVRLAEKGSLGDYVHANVPSTLRNALFYLIFVPDSAARKHMIAALRQEAQRHFGWGDTDIPNFLASAAPHDLIDFIEILIDKCTSADYRSEWNGHYWITTKVMPDVENQVNHLCERHRFGFRFEHGEGRKIGSPVLEVEIVGPTLLAVQRPGWEQVEKSFKEALHHQRGGETDDAITAAHAAVEAALKAVGMRGQFSTMARQFRTSTIVPPYLRETPDALDALMKLLDRSNAIRSTAGDAHGRRPPRRRYRRRSPISPSTGPALSSSTWPNRATELPVREHR